MGRRAAARPESSPWGFHGARRMMSSAPQRAPPVSQVLFDNEAQVNSARWVGAIEFLKKNSPVKRWSTNRLNRELVGADPNQLTLSDVGISLLETLIYICLGNCNRGYNQKDYFKKENVLINPEFVHFRLKEVGYCLLDRNSPNFLNNRIGAYSAACEMFIELLKEVEGEDVMDHLSVLVKDLFYKMKRPTDQRLIVFHPALLRAQGASAFFMRAFHLVRKVHHDLSSFGSLLLVHICDHKIAATVRSHPLLNHILVNRGTNPNAPAQPQGPQPNPSGHPQGPHPYESAKKKQMRENFICARMAIEVPRHTIQHVFDESPKEVKSCVDHTELWPYTEDEVLELLLFVFGVTLIEIEEYFLSKGMWGELGVEYFWPRDLNRVGGVPAPSNREQRAIHRAGLHFMDR